MKYSIFALIALALAVAACSPQATATPAPTQTEASSATAGATATQPAASSSLTLDQLKNMAYQLLSASSPRSVTLKDGAFGSTDPTSPDYVRARLLDNVAFTDLNGDGKPDAAVLLAENYGGTGNFVSLVAMLNQNGQPVQGASAYIDDRPHINSLTAENGEIVLDAVVHAPADPMCCGTRHILMTFRLTSAGLSVESISTFTPDGKERSITIESPAEGTRVSGSVQVMGSFTISPFENTLVYKIYDATDKEIASGPITVTAPELGGPGTFDTTIDLSAVPAGTPVRISVQDLSAADGAILAMDSVNLTVK